MFLRFIRFLNGSNRASGNYGASVLDAKQIRIRKAGEIDGKHYPFYFEEIKRLKREKKHDEAIELLLKTIDATERESKAAGKGWGVAPWYYKQLAIVYRKEKRYDDEIAILERYKHLTNAIGALPEDFATRLKKAKELQKKTSLIRR